MPRFVVLTHDHPRLHWDFMLENEAALRTWRLERQPTETGPIAAEALAVHRLEYLDYEGPVSGNRGTVSAFDRGEFALCQDDGDLVEVELRGAKLRGRARLQRLPQSGAWQFEFAPEAIPGACAPG
jgi:hypothetical protein